MNRNDEAVKAALEGLKRDGVVKPGDVVDAARDEDSPLHGFFTWDDGEAAHLWRVEEARKLLRVYVVVEQAEVGEVRAFVSLSTDRKVKGGGYRALVDVMADEKLRAQMLSDALQELRATQYKYQSLTQLSGVWAALDEIEPPEQLADAA